VFGDETNLLNVKEWLERRGNKLQDRQPHDDDEFKVFQFACMCTYLHLQYGVL